MLPASKYGPLLIPQIKPINSLKFTLSKIFLTFAKHFKDEIQIQKD